MGKIESEREFSVSQHYMFLFRQYYLEFFIPRLHLTTYRVVRSKFFCAYFTWKPHLHPYFDLWNVLQYFFYAWNIPHGIFWAHLPRKHSPFLGLIYLRNFGSGCCILYHLSDTLIIILRLDLFIYFRDLHGHCVLAMFPAKLRIFIYTVRNISSYI